MPWTYYDQAREQAITDEIDRQEDRGAAIIAAALLEDRLETGVRDRLIRDTSVTNPLFKGNGAFSSFSTKSDLAYLLGLVTKRQHRSLMTIRKIRNEFAHKMEPITFETQNIKDMCATLSSIEMVAEARKLVEFTLKQAKRMEVMRYIDHWLAGVIQDKGAPRKTYINAIQLITFQILLGTRHSLFISSALVPLHGIPVLPHHQVTQSDNRIRQRRVRPRRSSPE